MNFKFQFPSFRQLSVVRSFFIAFLHSFIHSIAPFVSFHFVCSGVKSKRNPLVLSPRSDRAGNLVDGN